MRRKLIQQGVGLTVYIPKKWIDENDLKKGDEIDIAIKDNSLIMNCMVKSQGKEIRIDIGHLPVKLIERIIHQAYAEGYLTITLAFENKTFHDHKTGKTFEIIDIVQEFIKRYLGMEITNESEKSIQLSVFIDKESENSERVISRMRFLFDDFFDYILENVKNPKQMKLLQNKATIIKKFTFYGLRLTYKNQELLNQIFYSLMTIIEEVEYIIDHVREKSYKLSEETISVIKKTKSILSLIFELMAKFSEEKADQYEKIKRDIYHTIDMEYKTDVINSRIRQPFATVCTQTKYIFDKIVSMHLIKR